MNVQTIEAISYLTENVAITEVPIIRNKGLILFDMSKLTSLDNPFPMAKNHLTFMENLIKYQIDKKVILPYGFQFDFYVLLAHQNSGRSFINIKTSIWSTIHWVKQLPLSHLILNGYNQNVPDFNTFARVCIVGDWSKMNTYPIILYDAIKKLMIDLNIPIQKSNLYFETDFYKPPFGKAWTSSNMFEQDEEKFTETL